LLGLQAQMTASNRESFSSVMTVKLTSHTLSNSSLTQHHHNMLITRRNVLLSAIGRLLLPEQSTCWRPVCLVTTFRQKLKTNLFQQSYPDIVL